MKDKKCKTRECKNLISSRHNKFGLCGKCSREKYQEEHKEELKEYNENYYPKYLKENKKDWYEKNSRYRAKNQKKVKFLNKRRYDHDKKKFKDYSKNYYETHKEEQGAKHLEYVNRRYREDEAFRMRKRLGSSLGKVIRDYIKTGKVSNPLPHLMIDWKGIIKVLTPIPKPRSAYHVDHIIPLYKFDLSKIEHIHLAFAPENHRWLLIKDNLSRDKPNIKRRQKSK